MGLEQDVNVVQAGRRGQSDHAHRSVLRAPSPSPASAQPTGDTQWAGTLLAAGVSPNRHDIHGIESLNLLGQPAQLLHRRQRLRVAMAGGELPRAVVPPHGQTTEAMATMTTVSGNQPVMRATLMARVPMIFACLR